MPGWLKRLLGRKGEIPTPQWMNRARLALMTHVPSVYRPRVSMVADRSVVVLHVFCESGEEAVFKFQRSYSPEAAIKKKVGPWILKHEHPQ